MDCVQQVPFTSHQRIDHKAFKEEILHEVRCAMGLQQYKNQGRRPMESRI